MIKIHIIIGTILLQHLTGLVCQTNEKEMMLEIIIGYMVVIIHLYTIIILITDHTFYMEDNLITKCPIKVNVQ